MLQDLLKILIDYSLNIIPAFLFALLISAVLAETLPDSFFEKILNSNNIISIFFSSIIGALIPLCTCGMIPLANKLQKKGASWLISISFLTSGNASSITALFMTLVLGLKITFFRFVFAVVFGVIVAYVFALFFKPGEAFHETTLQHEITNKNHLIKKIVKEFCGLIICFGPWVITAIVVAGIISLFLNPKYVVNLAGTKNTIGPFVLAISGFPFYFCAGSDIPITKALLDKGASLGSILSFMTASPGVNLTSFFVYQKWLGLKSAFIYLAISFLVCGAMGLVVNVVMRL